MYTARNVGCTTDLFFLKCNNLNYNHCSINIARFMILSKQKKRLFIMCFYLNTTLIQKTFKMGSYGLILLKFDDFTATPILREIRFWRNQTVQKCYFCNFWDSEIWMLVNFGLESCSNLLKSKFRVSKIANNDILGPFEFAKTWFHAKSEWQ